MARTKTSTDAASKALRAFGLAYPGAHTKSPWPGHLDLAVRDKTFAYLSVEGEPFSISCKLPQSSEVALMLPFAEPTAYGLGKSGWVSASIPAGAAVPIEMFQAWIDESYRAQAPKKLVAMLDGAPANAPGRTRTKKAGTPKRAPTSKKLAGKAATKKRARGRIRASSRRRSSRAAPRDPSRR